MKTEENKNNFIYDQDYLYEKSIILEFPGRCDKNDCRASVSNNLSLIFGIGGLCLTDHFEWEFPCDECGKAWRELHNYIFDLAVVFHADDLMLRHKERKLYYYHNQKPLNILFDNEQLQEIKYGMKYLSFLYPIEKLIKGIIWGFIQVGHFCNGVNKFTCNYKNKLSGSKYDNSRWLK